MIQFYLQTIKCFLITDLNNAYLGVYLQEYEECANVIRIENNLLSLVCREQRESRFDAFFDCLGLRFKRLVYRQWIRTIMILGSFLFQQSMLDYVNVFLEMMEDFLHEREEQYQQQQQQQVALHIVNVIIKPSKWTQKNQKDYYQIT